MNILPRLAKSAVRELVFESPYGNKIYFKLSKDMLVHSPHKYLMEISPSVELKFHRWLIDNYPDGSYAFDLLPKQISVWSQRRLHMLDNILRILCTKETYRYPWVPCEEDRSLVRDYLNDNFKKAKNFCDMALLKEYGEYNTGELLDSQHPLVKYANKVLMYRSVTEFDSEMLGLGNFVAHVEFGKVAKSLLDLVSKPKKIPMNVVQYLLDKVE